MNNKRGVSLIALGIVIIVMVILASAVVYTSSSTANNAKKAAFASDLGTIEDAVKEYYLNNGKFRGELSSYNRVNLPEGYTQLEYIESTGTQYIADSYTIPNDAESFSIESTTEVSSTGEYCIVGCEPVSLEFGYSQTANRQFLYIYESAGYTSQESNINRKNYFKASVNANSFSFYTNLDGESSVEKTSHNIQDLRGATLQLMVYRIGGGRPYNFIGKTYEVKYVINGGIVRWFIPCYRQSDNEAGMYDIINNGFYTNAGTGTFIPGPEVAQDLILPIDMKSDTYDKATLTALVTDGKAELSDEISKNGDNDATFYVIDLDKLPIENIKNGKGKKGDNDIYVISNKNLNVYYVKGEKISSKYYFSLSERLTGKVKVANSSTTDNSNVAITNTAYGIKLTKSAAEWTNNLTVTVDTDLEEGETLRYKIADEIVGATTGTINVSEDLAGNATLRNKFYLNDTNKKVTVQKLNSSSEVIAESTINVTNLDILTGDEVAYTLNSNYTKYNDFIFATITGYNDVGGSGLKECRVIYTKKLDDEENEVPYYDNLPSSITAQYIYDSGKVAAANAIKLPADVTEYQIIFIDKAGNISTPKVMQVTY